VLNVMIVSWKGMKKQNVSVPARYQALTSIPKLGNSS
jgi:hypothetical protein